MSEKIEDEFMYSRDAVDGDSNNSSATSEVSFGEGTDKGEVSLDDLVMALIMSENLELGESHVFDPDDGTSSIS